MINLFSVKIVPRPNLQCSELHYTFTRLIITLGFLLIFSYFSQIGTYLDVRLSVSILQ